VTHALAYPGFV